MGSFSSHTQLRMPTGTPYNSYVLPYPIRVDGFAGIETVPALHLLTHTHSDHINGLSSKSFAATVICSPDAKEMLLRHEVYAQRALYEMDIRPEKIRTYAHLKVDPRKHLDGTMFYTGSRDLLVGDLDTRFGHFAYDALATCCAEHSHAYRAFRERTCLSHTHRRQPLSRRSHVCFFPAFLQAYTDPSPGF